MTITDLLDRINATILNPLILLLFSIAIAMFVWGIVQFIASKGSKKDSQGNASGGEGRTQGKRNIVWGLVGLFIMVSVYGIIRIILGTFDLNPPGLYIF